MGKSILLTIKWSNLHYSKNSVITQITCSFKKKKSGFLILIWKLGWWILVSDPWSISGIWKLGWQVLLFDLCSRDCGKNRKHPTESNILIGRTKLQASAAQLARPSSQKHPSEVICHAFPHKLNPWREWVIIIICCC